MKLTDYKIGIFNYYWWRDFYYNHISSRIWPRQKWLTKKIPRTWVDKDRLIEICIFEMIKDYVEGEKCLEVLCLDNPPEQSQFLREVRDMYNIITNKIPKLEKELEEAWDEVPHRSLDEINKSNTDDYEKIYGRVNALEKEIFDIQTKVMLWAVNNRAGIWT